jgi:Na+-translocating ferredoxin:NAD+ oxidoreductase RnfG subunit
MTLSTKQSIKNVAVFCVIALVSGLVLGLVNHFTTVDPKAEAIRKFNALFPTAQEYTVVDEKAGNVLYVAESENVVAILSKGKGGFKGEVQAYVFFVEGKIALLAVGEHKETYVGKLQADKFFERFIGKNTSAAFSEIDGVTGATRSSNAVKNAVTAAAEYYKEHYEGGQNGR